jgi:hypothetical protein
MPDEVANLILEQLRVMRPDINEMRSEIKTLGDRIKGLETQVQGLTYIVTTTIGALVVDTKEIKRRLSALESRS